MLKLIEYVARAMSKKFPLRGPRRLQKSISVSTRLVEKLHIQTGLLEWSGHHPLFADAPLCSFPATQGHVLPMEQ